MVAAQDDVLMYERRAETERLLIALNFGHAPRSMRLPAGVGKAVTLASTHLDREGAATDLSLRADEGVVMLLRE
jgi:hypothetical protein